MGWYPSIHSQDGNIKGVSDVSSEFNGLRIALITEVLPLDACVPVAPMGPNSENMDIWYFNLIVLKSYGVSWRNLWRKFYDKLPPEMNAANEFGEEEFVEPKKNFASCLPSIRFNPSFSLLLHLVLGNLSQSKSLVHVPENMFSQ